MSRAEILNRIRHATADAGPDPSIPETITSRHRHGPRDLKTLCAMMAKACAETGTHIHELSSFENVPETVAQMAVENAWPASGVRVANHSALTSLDWGSFSTAQDGSKKIRFGAASANDFAGISVADCAIAETGTIMLCSGPDSPTTLAFLTEVHIVIVEQTKIVATLADAFHHLPDVTESVGTRLPRTVNLISGASRTADIESTIVKGAHGPRQLHVVIIEDGNGTQTQPEAR